MKLQGSFLVDATQEDRSGLTPRAWADSGGAMRRRAQRQAFWAPLYVGLGLARLQLQLEGREVPPVILQSKYLRARASEFQNIEVSAEQARTTGHVHEKPLLVLTAGRVIDASLKAMLNKEASKGI